METCVHEHKCACSIDDSIQLVEKKPLVVRPNIMFQTRDAHRSVRYQGKQWNVTVSEWSKR